MTFAEKKLYHQIHPLKLSVDICSGILTTYLSWQHDIFWFLILFLLPSVIVSILTIKYADLEKLKNSGFGKYIEKYMTTSIEVIRIVGQIIIWTAGWYHLAIIMIIGFLIIIGAWCNGLLIKKHK